MLRPGENRLGLAAAEINSFSFEGARLDWLHASGQSLALEESQCLSASVLACSSRGGLFTDVQFARHVWPGQTVVFFV